MPSTAATEPRSAPPTVSPGVRTTISFLLFLHMFAVLAAVFSNPPSADLVRRLRNVPGLAAWTHQLFMDHSGRFALTQGRQWDMASYLAVQPTGGEPIVFPPRGLWPPLRQQRYENLAHETNRLGWVAMLDENSLEVQNDRETLLPRAIAARLLKDVGATGGNVHLRGRILLNTDQAMQGRSIDVSTADLVAAELPETSLVQGIFDGDISLTPSDEVIFQRRSDEGRLNAPAAKDAATGKAK